MQIANCLSKLTDNTGLPQADLPAMDLKIHQISNIKPTQIDRAGSETCKDKVLLKVSHIIVN